MYTRWQNVAVLLKKQVSKFIMDHMSCATEIYHRVKRCYCWKEYNSVSMIRNIFSILQYIYRVKKTNILGSVPKY